jgi:ketosteroid isomerase-like protein
MCHAGPATAVDHWASQWDDFRVELTELIDARRDVVAVTRQHGAGRASGVPVGALVSHVFTVEDGRLVRMRIFATKAQALEAAGCAVSSEPAPSRCCVPASCAG